MKKNQTIIHCFFAIALSGCTSQFTNDWVLQKTPTKERLRGISVVSENVVWASGNRGTCIRTTDGGSTWEKINIPGSDSLDFRDVEAFDAYTAYILSIGYGRQSRIYKTADGGQSWKLQFLNTDTTAFFDAFAFWNRDAGIAVSDAVAGRWILVTTDNGGKNWELLPAHQSPTALSGEGAFAASGTCITTYGDSMVWIGTGVNAARVLSSTDRGKNWLYSQTSIAQSNGTSGIFSITFFDEKKGVVCGGDFQNIVNSKNSIAISINGGANWRLAQGTLPSGFRSSVVWINENLLITTGPSGTDYSSDGGNNWHIIDTIGFHTSGFKEGILWGAGENGRVGKLSININVQKQ